MFSHFLPLPLHRQQTRDEIVRMAGLARINFWNGDAKGPDDRSGGGIAGPARSMAASMMERKANDFPLARYRGSVRKAIARKAMVGSAENNLEGVFEAPTAEPADDGDFGPSVEDGVRLVRAFVSIRSPERRQAVLEYALDQAKMDLR